DRLFGELGEVPAAQEVSEAAAGALRVAVRRAGAGLGIVAVHAAEVDAVAGAPGAVRYRGVQLGAREELDRTGAGDDAQLVREVELLLGPGLHAPVHADLLRGGEAAGPVPLVVVVVARAVLHRAVEVERVEGQAVVARDRIDR